MNVVRNFVDARKSGPLTRCADDRNHGCILGWTGSECPSQNRDAHKNRHDIYCWATISWPPTFVNTGTLYYAVSRPVFIAGGIDFLAVGFNARAQQTLPAPLPLTYNLEPDSGLSAAFAKSCDLLVRSICSNGSLLADELQWRDVG